LIGYTTDPRNAMLLMYLIVIMHATPYNYIEQVNKFTKTKFLVPES